MKKFNPSFLILITMLVLGSCIKENNAEENIQPGTEPIVFGLETNSETRAKAITDTLLSAGSKFGIYGYKAASGASYFGSLEATVDDASGMDVTYDTQYWPASSADKINFYAYYPFTVNSGATLTPSIGVDGTAYMKLEYTAAENYANHNDLMAASTTSKSHGEKVGLKFYHALTRLTFEAKKANDFGTDVVTITSISIENIKRTGVLKVTSTVGSDVPTFAWEPTGAANQKYTSSFSPIAAANYSAATNDYTKIEGFTDDSFMVIPMAKSEFGDAILVVVTSYGTYKKSLSEIHETKATSGWIAGEWINYQLLLKRDAIEIEGVTVNPWDGPKDVPVEF